MRVVEICRAGRSINGGLLGVGDCREMVKKGQGIGGEIDVTQYVLLIPLGWKYSLRLALWRRGRRLGFYC